MITTLVSLLYVATGEKGERFCDVYCQELNPSAPSWSYCKEGDGGSVCQYGNQPCGPDVCRPTCNEYCATLNPDAPSWSYCKFSQDGSAVCQFGDQPCGEDLCELEIPSDPGTTPIDFTVISESPTQGQAVITTPSPGMSAPGEAEQTEATAEPGSGVVSRPLVDIAASTETSSLVNAARGGVSSLIDSARQGPSLIV